MKTVYVAGPYTNPDPVSNTNKAIAAANDLIDLGFAPFVPHLYHWCHEQAPRDYEDWMAVDFAWVRRSDFLLRLPGESPGADREVDLAKELGIPVCYSVADVQQAAQP